MKPEVKVIIVGSGTVGRMALEKLNTQAPELEATLIPEVDFKRETIAENEVVFLASELLAPKISKGEEAAEAVDKLNKSFKKLEHPINIHKGSKFHK